MEKPIQLILSDLRQEIISNIENKNLPMCLVTPIIKDIYEQCKLIETQQYNAVKANYEDSLKEKTEEKK